MKKLLLKLGEEQICNARPPAFTESSEMYNRSVSIRYDGGFTDLFSRA